MYVVYLKKKNNKCGFSEHIPKPLCYLLHEGNMLNVLEYFLNVAGRNGSLHAYVDPPGFQMACAKQTCKNEFKVTLRTKPPLDTPPPRTKGPWTKPPRTKPPYP